MPPARPRRHAGVRHGCKLLAPCRVEAAEQQRDDRVVVDRADRTPADGAESAARARRGSPRGGASTGADPRDAVARELDPRCRESPRVSLAHPAGAGVRIRRRADRTETDVRTEAPTLEARCLHGLCNTLSCICTRHAGVASLRPTMPATIRPRLRMRPVLAGSLKSTMPRMAVPTAPTPTHTA